MLRMASVVLLLGVVLAAGARPASADEPCALAVLCPPPPPSAAPGPIAPPAPAPALAPAPAPEPEPAPRPQPSPAPAAEAADDAPAAARLVELVNQTRAEHGLVPLAPHAAAEAIAVEHSRAMAAAHDIWHNDALFTKTTKQRLGARTVAENVALNDSAEGAHARIMASDGHRKNILDRSFTAGAVGAVRGDDGRLYLTEVFLESVVATRAGTTAPSKAPARPAATSAPSVAAVAAPAPVPEAAAPEREAIAAADTDGVEIAAGPIFAAPVPRGPGLEGPAPTALAVLALAGVLAGAAQLALNQRRTWTVR